MFRKIFTLVAFCSLMASTGFAQGKTYFTKTGKITFFSQATLEDIEARNSTATVMLESHKGAVQFAVQMNGFEFDKKAMQQHFNDSYVESEKFPKSEFVGHITNNKDINYHKDGSYNAKVKGKLTIHGVTKDVDADGTIKVSGGKLSLNSVFHVALADYNVKTIKDKIADKIKVTVDCGLEEYKK